MIIDYNRIIDIYREAARFFTIPGVVRGERGSIVLTQDELRMAFRLSRREMGGYAEIVGLGFGRDRIVGAGDKKMPAARLEARLGEIRDRRTNLERSASERKGQRRGILGVLRRR